MKSLSYTELFKKFLGFGFLAWGGPVAQISLMYEQLVEREKWLSKAHFNRVLAIYQALPGPEATELAVYFGYLKKGRLGGLLSGLGFILPGFLLVLLLSYLYVNHSFQSGPAQAFLYGVKPAILALIVIAVYKISRKALKNDRLWLTVLLTAGVLLFYQANLVLVLFAGAAFYYVVRKFNRNQFLLFVPLIDSSKIADVFLFFLKAGLFTFGGAYTVIPFVQQGAIGEFGWLTPQQFLDGLALSALVPGPLIIVSTFVGYMAAGPLGAIVGTFAIFLPAFLFTLVGFSYIEKLMRYPRLQIFLDGLTASVVAAISIATLNIAQAAIVDILAVIIFVTAFAALWKHENIAVIVLASGLVGLGAKLLLL